MTLIKFRKVVNFYWNYVREEGFTGQRFNPENKVPQDSELNRNYICMHYVGYCANKIINDFIPAGRIEKAMRWLGFIQGALWMSGVFSVDELREHSRPDDEEEDTSPPEFRPPSGHVTVEMFNFAKTDDPFHFARNLNAMMEDGYCPKCGLVPVGCEKEGCRAEYRMKEEKS